MPGFREALEDTIRALGTGIRQTREGVRLANISSRHELKSARARSAFADIERAVARLRSRFDELVAVGEIQPCRDRCNDPKCSVYVSTEAAVREMNDLRSGILRHLRRVCPSFEVKYEW